MFRANSVTRSANCPLKNLEPDSMHIFQSRFLRRGEVWFDEKPDQAPVDWIYYRQCPSPVSGAGCKYFYTLLVELEDSPDALLKSFNKSIRYNINRASARDKFVCENTSHITDDMLTSFGEVYKPFATQKGLGALDRARLGQLAKEGCLHLSIVRDREGMALVQHVYYRGTKRSSLMHSVSVHYSKADSLERNAVGRANCLLTWCDMLRLREEGLKHFDFGGWYSEHKDQARLNINRFKEGFGGKIVREHNCEQILTLKARLILTIAKVLDRIKPAIRRYNAARVHSQKTQQIRIAHSNTLPTAEQGERNVYAA